MAADPSELLEDLPQWAVPSSGLGDRFVVCVKQDGYLRADVVKVIPRANVRLSDSGSALDYTLQLARRPRSSTGRTAATLTAAQGTTYALVVRALGPEETREAVLTQAQDAIDVSLKGLRPGRAAAAGKQTTTTGTMTAPTATVTTGTMTTATPTTTTAAAAVPTATATTATATEALPPGAGPTSTVAAATMTAPAATVTVATTTAAATTTTTAHSIPIIVRSDDSSVQGEVQRLTAPALPPLPPSPVALPEAPVMMTARNAVDSVDHSRAGLVTSARNGLSAGPAATPTLPPAASTSFLAAQHSRSAALRSALDVRMSQLGIGQRTATATTPRGPSAGLGVVGHSAALGEGPTPAKLGGLWAVSPVDYPTSPRSRLSTTPGAGRLTTGATTPRDPSDP